MLVVKESEAVEELNKIIIEITEKLFENGTSIKLISGVDSLEYSQKLDENLKDDNGIVYRSIVACTSTEQERITKEIVNKEKEKLLKLKQQRHITTVSRNFEFCSKFKFSLLEIFNL